MPSHASPPRFSWANLAPLATVFIWSGNTIVTKGAAGVISPGSIAFYRWFLALIILLPLAGPAAWRNRRAARLVWKKLAAAGVLGLVVYQCLAYVAAQSTSAVNMGIIFALMPLLAVVLASVFAAERLAAARIAGGLISMAGLVYLISRGHPGALLQGGLHLGDALMLVAVASNALYGVLLKRWALPLPLWQQLFWQVLAATIVLLPIWLLGPISPVTPASLPLILYAAIPASLLAPWLWMTGINRLGATKAAMTANLLPVFVALLAWLLLGEQLHLYHFIGGGAALLGVVIGLREWNIRNPKNKDTEGAIWPLEES